MAGDHGDAREGISPQPPADHAHSDRQAILAATASVRLATCMPHRSTPVLNDVRDGLGRAGRW